MKPLALTLALAVNLTAATLPESIERLIAASPLARSAYWGIEMVDLGTGKTLYGQNAGHFFVPASNAKLFTTSMALGRLGPDFTFQTRVMADQPADHDGRLAGSLRLVGGGDPNLSDARFSYKPGAITGDPLAALAELADQAVARVSEAHRGRRSGRRLPGMSRQPYAAGWSVDLIRAPTTARPSPRSPLTTIPSR